MKRVLVLWLAFVAQTSLWAASTAWQINPHGQVRLIAEPEQAVRDAPLLLGVEFKTIPGWHVYWSNPGDAGYPPKADWSGSQGVQQIEWLWPAPNRYDLPGGLTAIGYEGEVVYPIRAQIHTASDTAHIQLQLNYLTCNDSCVPYKYFFRLDLPVNKNAMTDTEAAPLIKHWMAQVPTPVRSAPSIKLRAELMTTPQGSFAVIDLTGPSEALPTNHLDIYFEKNADGAFGKPVTVKEPDGWRLQAAAASFTGQPLPHKLRLGFVVTGELSNGSRFAVSDRETLSSKKKSAPPVTPATEQTVQPFDQPPLASAPPATQASLVSILLLAFLGGLLLNVMPCVLPVLSIKLLGLLQHAGHLRRVIIMDALASTAGILVSFLALALIGIMARLAGHAVGWGIQFQQPIFVGVMAGVVLLFALNLLGLFEINLPGSIAQLGTVNREKESFGSYFSSGLFATLLATPCSAPFLGTATGFALSQSAGVILAIFFAAGIGMSFPYLLLAVFPQTVYWLPKPGMWMLHVKRGMGILLAITFLWLVYVLIHQLKAPSSSAHSISSSSHPSAGEPQWAPFSEESLSRELSKGNSVFVDITADWCFTCKVNEARVLSDVEVLDALRRDHVTLLRGDWTTHDPSIDAFLKRMGRAGIPFNAFYRPGKPPVLFSEFLSKRAVLAALQSS